jgi:hypothetical protein
MILRRIFGGLDGEFYAGTAGPIYPECTITSEFAFCFTSAPAWVEG